MTNPDTLLPCPFCGGEAEFNDTSSTWVRCEDCGAETQCQIEKKDAAQLWNRRTPAPQDHVMGGSLRTTRAVATVRPETRIAELEFELKAKTAELEIANGEIERMQARLAASPLAVLVGVKIATAEDHNAAFDPADEALGGAFKAGFKEGWIYAEVDADGDRYQEMAEEYGLAVDTAPQECWDAHREKFFAMLPLAAIPEVGSAVGDVEAEIASVVQSVNEWDDRTSPDDYPEHLLITSEELATILRNFAETLATSEAAR